MKQSEFEQRHRPDWRRFRATLDLLERRRKKKKGAKGKRAHVANRSEEPLQGEALLTSYRRLCQQLAVARARHYGTALIDELDELTLRGYAQLYRTPSSRWSEMLDFVVAQLPLLVRREAGLFWLCTALFYGPLLLLALWIAQNPEWIYSLMDEATVAGFEKSYGSPGENRDSESDLLMLGFYIKNNIGIGFRTFAGGILFGVGSLVILLFNGVYIGAVTGYLIAQGHSENFFTFVIAHAAFELTGIVLAGMAGMKMGLALLAPGRLRRVDALKRAAREAIGLVYGMAALLLIAAFVEAFWSSNQGLPASIKYAVGALCWASVLIYFLRPIGEASPRADHI